MATRIQVPQLVKALLNLNLCIFVGIGTMIFDTFDRHSRKLPISLENGTETTFAQHILLAPIFGRDDQFYVIDLWNCAGQIVYVVVGRFGWSRGRFLLSKEKIENE